jgi:hypothetical protein
VQFRGEGFIDSLFVVLVGGRLIQDTPLDLFVMLGKRAVQCVVFVFQDLKERKRSLSVLCGGRHNELLQRCHEKFNGNSGIGHLIQSAGPAMMPGPLGGILSTKQMALPRRLWK